MQKIHLLKKQNFTCGKKLTWNSYLVQSLGVVIPKFYLFFKLLNTKVPTSYEREPSHKLSKRWQAGDGQSCVGANIMKMQAIKFLRSLSLFRKSANAATAVRDLHLKVVLVSSSLYFPFEESVNMCCPPLCPFLAIWPISWYGSFLVVNQ